MKWVLREIQQIGIQSPSQQPLFVIYPPPPSLVSNGWDLNNKVSPSVLLIIIIILAVIFFVFGLLHLLVRFLLRPPTREPDAMDNVTVLQGQLQQLFHLHDSGVDQTFIDALPVFNYKAIIGAKDPFDCAVCLCEFESEDKLRLLPKCSHAFHMDCIDTWLLSHSTCPLCRASLLPDFSTNTNNFAPILLVLESGESSREIVSEMGMGSTNSIARVSSCLSSHRQDPDPKSGEIQAKSEEKSHEMIVVSGEKVMQVKLGKFRNIDGGGECSSGGDNAATTSSESDARRCFSMGSFAYVMDDNSSLQVAVRTPLKKQFSKKPSLPLTPWHRHVMSECGGDSVREFNGIEAFKMLEVHSGGSSDNMNTTKSFERCKGESFSISKIWLREKKDKANAATTETSRRAVSFRFPATGDELKGKNATTSTASEIHMSRWENCGSEMGFEDENQSCHSLDSQSNPQSFARRSLLWFMGRSNRAVPVHSFSSNV